MKKVIIIFGALLLLCMSSLVLANEIQTLLVEDNYRTTDIIIKQNYVVK